jgi:hypothetical protein
MLDLLLSVAQNADFCVNSHSFHSINQMIFTVLFNPILVCLFLQWAKQRTILWLLLSSILKVSAMVFTPLLFSYGMRRHTNLCQVRALLSQGYFIWMFRGECAVYWGYYIICKLKIHKYICMNFVFVIPVSISFLVVATRSYMVQCIKQCTSHTVQYSNLFDIYKPYNCTMPLL